jgi:hypothetical protein
LIQAICNQRQAVRRGCALINIGSGNHNFSAAAAFFEISRVEPGSKIPSDGAVEVGPHQTVDVALTP